MCKPRVNIVIEFGELSKWFHRHVSPKGRTWCCLEEVQEGKKRGQKNSSLERARSRVSIA